MIQQGSTETGATACLPANLSDYWLDWLANELDFLKGESKVGPNYIWRESKHVEDGKLRPLRLFLES